MPRIELPPLDADSFEARLEEAIPKTPKGKTITAWHTFSTGVKSMRTMLQDGHNAQDEQINGKDGIKKHLDRVDDREAAHYAELKSAVAALGGSPFGG